MKRFSQSLLHQHQAPKCLLPSSLPKPSPLFLSSSQYNSCNNTTTPVPQFSFSQHQRRNIVQLKTILQVQDNCGAIEVECVTVPKTRKGHARVGSLIVVVVKKARPNRKVKKKQVCRAIVTQTRDMKQRESGISYASGENRCVIVDHKMAPVGSRIFGSLPVELRGQKYAKILSMASAVF